MILVFDLLNTCNVIWKTLRKTLKCSFFLFCPTNIEEMMTAMNDVIDVCYPRRHYTWPAFMHLLINIRSMLVHIVELCGCDLFIFMFFLCFAVLYFVVGLFLLSLFIFLSELTLSLWFNPYCLYYWYISINFIYIVFFWLG